MKHVTITLPNDTLSRLRIAAAENGKSMSSFVAGLIEQHLGRRTQAQALDVFLAGPELPGLAASWQGRGELYDEGVVRRHECDPVSERPAGSAEAGDRPALARRARRA
jgi:hypothetical protein